MLYNGPGIRAVVQVNPPVTAYQIWHDKDESPHLATTLFLAVVMFDKDRDIETLGKDRMVWIQDT